MTTTYEQDFFTWTQEQATYLKQGRLELLDLEHLAEEVADMGRSERRELASRLAVIITHLLKLQVQTQRTSANEKSWRRSIIEQRRAVSSHLSENAGLKNPLQSASAFDTAWVDGLSVALRETGLDPDLFPEDNPYRLEQLLDPDFWPSVSSAAP
ncbi:DUF29 domain-containing protein [Thiorhodococcus mannitoliphagus]|uniref:DUF29 domain-containing protein n=1 Tax=Thiorhodococcus mannitoliphagus TaxID=329406 RepID=A0A6P1DPD7_9GAMM|nr:DUF29 domain-containing protein [Thiorhodococcus mannitoliphagus]NEX19013.1 DUF29 domain-containing protein [Thiorhodococcus mannitoliphagus]